MATTFNGINTLGVLKSISRGHMAKWHFEWRCGYNKIIFWYIW